jgi:hypothetical protein
MAPIERWVEDTAGSSYKPEERRRAEVGVIERK